MSLAWAHACLHMGINGRRDFEKGFEEKEAADPSLGCGQLSGQSCWAEFKTYVCVFHCFSFPNCQMSGPFLGPGNGPILGPRHIVFYCGVLFWGVQTEARFLCKWVDWCAQQAQLQGHELLWLNMDETCVQRGMPTASGAVAGPTVFHIVYLLGLAANYLGSLSLIPTHSFTRDATRLRRCLRNVEKGENQKQQHLR